MNAFLEDRQSVGDYSAYLILFLIALATRFFFLIHVDEPVIFFKYPFFAEKLVQGIDIGERLVDLSPFYLYFLTFLNKVFHLDWDLVKPIQSFVGILNCLMVYALGRRVFGKEAGLFAALLFTFYGNLIVLESTLEPTVFVLLFSMLAVYFLLEVKEHSGGFNKKWGYAAVAGFFAGLSIITKPNFLLFLPVGAAWILFLGNRDSRISTRFQTLVFCFVALVVVLPVTVRNYVKLNDFVLVTADAGKVFFHGNGKGATALEGTGLPDEGFMEEAGGEPDYAHVLYRKTASRLAGKDLTPSESSRFWMGRTLNEIRNNPAGYVMLEVEKLFYFFNDYEMHYIASAYKEYKAIQTFPFVRYGIIASLGLLGMALSLGRFKELFLVYGIVFVYLLSGMLFLVQSRYRMPAVPYLCLFAGYSVYALKKMVTSRRLKQAAVALVVVGLLFALTRLVFRGDILRVDQWQQATKIHYQMGGEPLYKRGQYKDAISELSECLAIAPDFSPAHNLMGKSHAMLGELTEAASSFGKVIALSPELAEGYKNLGYVHLLQDDREKAWELLLKALSIDPNDDKLKQEISKLRMNREQS
ncbi:MAG: glycosyltransferase family 39 protein [Deltaproteobacteria bacterium]|nr:glycosyltransferase family 39 protein [Deltaproteobacteria bacterium]